MVTMLLALACLAPSVAANDPPPSTTNTIPTTDTGVAARYGALPLAFAANMGQADAGVRFVAHGDKGFALTLAPDALTLALGGQHPATQGTPGGGSGTAAAVAPSTTLRLAFAGANPTPTLAAEAPLPGVTNSFIGNDPTQWHTNVPTSARVRYTALYPGIDLTVYGTEGGGLEYDTLVAPGADPTAFALTISGADTVTIDAGTGELVLATGAGEVRWHAPVAYQEVDGTRVAVTARYVVGGDGTVGFAVGDYNAALPLVIDPALVYSTFLGGSGPDVGNGIAVDSAGNAYVIGIAANTVDSSSSMDFPITPGAFQHTFGGGDSDIFVTKMNVTGTALVYSTFLGGSDADEGDGIAVDGAGNAYITGRTFSADFPTTPGAYQLVRRSAYSNAFVTKLSADGHTLVFSTFLGGSDNNGGNGIAVDGAGNTYVTGSAQGPNFPTTPGAFQTIYGGVGADVFVTKLSADGHTLVFSTFLGSTDEGRSIAVDGAGNAYVTGYTGSPNFPITPGAFQTIFGSGFNDAFVTKLSADGKTLVYSTYLGGNDLDGGTGIAVDSGGNAYVTGYTSSPNFPTTPGAFQTTFGAGNTGGGDAFVTKMSADGHTLMYSTYLGSNDEDQGRSIAVDSTGNAYVMGDTNSVNFPTTPGAFQTTNSRGDEDFFVTKMNPTGTALVYSTYLSVFEGYCECGDPHDQGIAVDGAGNAYVTSNTSNANFPTTPGAYQTTPGSSYFIFVTKLNPMGTALVYSTFLGRNSGANSYGIAVDGAGNAYVTGITYDRTNYPDLIFPTTPGAYQTTYGGDYDVFVTKLNATGTALVYSTLLGGDGNDRSYGIAVDGAGNAYVTGNIYYFPNHSVNFPTTPGAFQTTFGGSGTAQSSGDGGDAFVAKLNPTGTALLYSTYLGGSDNENGRGIAVDGAGNAYITGSTYSTNFPTTPGAFQTTYAGPPNDPNDGGDAFVAKFMLASIPLALGPTTLANAVIGNPYLAHVVATGGTAPYTYTVSTGTLPPGLSLSSATGTLSGTPTHAGASSFTVRVTDAAGGTVSQTYTLTVVAPTVEPAPRAGAPPAASPPLAHPPARTQPSVPPAMTPPLPVPVHR